MAAGTLVLRRPGTLVLIEPGGPEAGTLVRKVAGLAPLRCGCGCGRRMSADEVASVFERGAVLS